MTSNKLWPFHIREGTSGQATLILSEFNYKEYVFAEQAGKGWRGDSYDWSAVASVVIDERLSDLAGTISLEPDDNMFAASGDTRAIRVLADEMKEIYDDVDMIRDLLSRAHCQSPPYVPNKPESTHVSSHPTVHKEGKTSPDIEDSNVARPTIYQLKGLKVTAIGFIISIFLYMAVTVIDLAGIFIPYISPAALIGVVVCLIGIRMTRDTNPSFRRAAKMATVVLVIGGIESVFRLFIGLDPTPTPLSLLAFLIIIPLAIFFIMCIYNLILGCKAIALENKKEELIKNIKITWYFYIGIFLCAGIIANIFKNSDLPSYSVSLLQLVATTIAELFLVQLLLTTYRTYQGKKPPQ